MSDKIISPYYNKKWVPFLQEQKKQKIIYRSEPLKAFVTMITWSPTVALVSCYSNQKTIFILNDHKIVNNYTNVQT
jgi:hypothetical protein